MPEHCSCYDEVARLHDFFQGWFRGDLATTEFVRCESALGEEFTIVTPGGELISREELLGALRLHRGRETGSFTIETTGRSCHRVNDVHLVNYEERQSGPRSTVRLSTAAITEDSGRFVWHSVHETWVTV